MLSGCCCTGWPAILSMSEWLLESFKNTEVSILGRVAMYYVLMVVQSGPCINLHVASTQVRWPHLRTCPLMEVPLYLRMALCCGVHKVTQEHNSTKSTSLYSEPYMYVYTILHQVHVYTCNSSLVPTKCPCLQDTHTELFAAELIMWL